MGCIANAAMLFMLIVAFLFYFNISNKFNVVAGATVPKPLAEESGSKYLKQVDGDGARKFPHYVVENAPSSDDELPQFGGDEESGPIYFKEVDADESRFRYEILQDELPSNDELPQFDDGKPLDDVVLHKFVIYPDDEMGSLSNQTRFRRFPKSCNDTIQRLKNAVITCWAWPNFLTCEINCSHGYAMKENGNIQRSTIRKCRESKPKWYPVHYFPSCQPYIHCDVVLNTPGHLKCHSKPPGPRFCDIECNAYDDHDEVPERRYECMDDKYGKTLPPCASLNKSARLLPPPQA